MSISSLEKHKFFTGMQVKHRGKANRTPPPLFLLLLAFLSTLNRVCEFVGHIFESGILDVNQVSVIAKITLGLFDKSKLKLFSFDGIERALNVLTVKAVL